MSNLVKVVDNYVIFNDGWIECIVIDIGVSFYFNMVINNYIVGLRDFNLLIFIVCIIEIIWVNYGRRLD